MGEHKEMSGRIWIRKQEGVRKQVLGAAKSIVASSSYYEMDTKEVMIFSIVSLFYTTFCVAGGDKRGIMVSFN